MKGHKELKKILNDLDLSHIKESSDLKSIDLIDVLCMIQFLIR